MTIIDAVKIVMRQHGKPMTAKEAYDAIIKKRLYSFKAKKPAHIVVGQIRRHCKGIDFPSASDTRHFVLCTDGRFFPLEKIEKKRKRKTRQCLAITQQLRIRKPSNILTDLKTLHDEHRSAINAEILAGIRKLNPYDFEKFAMRLMEAYGFIQMQVTQVSQDGGIDGFGKLKIGLAHLNVAFQCKKWRGTVGRPEVDRFRGAIQGQYEQGMLFITSSFTSGAAEASFRPGAVPIILIDGESIVELMVERSFGVQTENLPIHSNALDLVFASDFD